MSRRTLSLAALLCASAFLVALPAHAVYQCGPETDDCTCGGSNPFPCCDNGGNCTWWAWQSACCHWGIVVPMLGNANTWAGVAASDPNFEVLSYPVVNSIACRVSGEYGHVAWVTAVNGSTITVSEMNCWGNYGVRDWTYDASYFDGGYIVTAGSQCECTAGEEQSQSCGDCGSQTRQCGSDCKWGSWGACAGPNPPGECDTGLLGPCGSGEFLCVEGNTQCVETVTPSQEVCDGEDNDCDGVADEENVCGGAGAGGAAGAGGSGGSGTTGGSGGGTAGSWPQTDAGDAETGASSGDTNYYNGGDADGCACRTVDARSVGGHVLWLAVLLPLLRRRRRSSKTDAA